MSKHTAGPWSFRPNSADTPECRCIEVVGSGHVDSIAYLQSYTNIDGSYDDRDATMANARLIAAAPDLFEALIAMSEQFCGTDINPGDAKANSMALLAIAKATRK